MSRDPNLEELDLEELAVATSIKAKADTWDEACRLFSPTEDEDEGVRIPSPLPKNK